MQEHVKYEYPESAHKHVGYPYRVWLFTLLCCPFATLVLLSSGYLEIPADVRNIDYFLLFIFQFIFFAPAGIIYLIAFWFFSSAKFKPVQVKALLTLTAIVCFYLTSVPLSENFHAKVVYSYFLVFAVIFTIVSFSFRLEEK